MTDDSVGLRPSPGERGECVGGETDPIYHGLATGMCPSCGEFVALISDGHTVRHWNQARAAGDAR